MVGSRTRELQDGAPDTINGREVLAVLRRRKWMIIAASTVLTLLASVMVALLPPRYKAVALLLVDLRESQIVQLHTPVSNLSLTAESGVMKTEVGILGSDDIIRRVVTRMELFNRPEFQKTPTILNRLNMVIGDVLQKAVPDYAAQLSRWYVSGDVAEESAIPVAIERYRRALSVANSEGSYLIELSFEAKDPELAAAIVGEHASTYLEQKQGAQAEVNRQASAWLEEQHDRIDEKLRDIEQKAQQFRERHNIVSAGTTTAVAQRLTAANAELGKAEGELAELGSRLAQLQHARSMPGGIFSVSDVLASHLIEHYRQQEADLLRRETDLSQQYGARHPYVIEINAQVQNLRAKIAEEVDRIARGLSNQVSTAKARVAVLRENYEGIERQATEEDEAAVKVKALEREAETMRRVDENFLSREKEVAANSQLQIPYARIISAPTRPPEPAGSGKVLLIGAIAGGSLAFATMLAFVRERLDDGLRSLDDAEEAFGLRGVDGIPLVPRARWSRLLPCDEIVRRPTSLYAERIRALGRSLQGSLDRNAHVVLVTSALPGEGKTSLTVSLGRSLVRIGKHVLVVEADLRRPMLSRMIMPTDEQGLDLKDCLSGRAAFQNCVRTDPKSSLHYLAVREPAVVPQDLLESERMQNMLESAREEYDYILIDSPPIAAVSDALIVGRLVDAVLFVVRWNSTSKSLVHSALSRLQQDVLTPIRLVLSNVDVRNRAAFRESDFEYHLTKMHYYYNNRPR